MKKETWWEVWTYAPLVLTPLALLAYLLATDGTGIQGAAIGPAAAMPTSVNVWTVLLLIGSVYVLWMISMVAAAVNRRR